MGRWTVSQNIGSLFATSKQNMSPTSGYLSICIPLSTMLVQNSHQTWSHHWQWLSTDKYFLPSQFSIKGLQLLYLRAEVFKLQAHSLNYSVMLTSLTYAMVLIKLSKPRDFWYYHSNSLHFSNRCKLSNLWQYLTFIRIIKQKVEQLFSVQLTKLLTRS